MRTRSQTKNFKSTTHPYLLCVVDMQTDFSAADCSETQQRNLMLIKQAMEDKAFIVFAHYEGCGPTHPHLTHPTRDYPYVDQCWANQNDKSTAVMRLIQKHEIEYDRILVTGVNTDACVKSTVEGLIDYHHLGTEIHVYQKACNAQFQEQEAWAYRSMERDGATILRKISISGNCKRETATSWVNLPCF